MHYLAVMNAKRLQWKKIITIALGSLISLLLILWAGLYWYISTHKQEIIHSIRNKVAEELGGSFYIKDIQPDLFSSFPHASVRLDSISLHDSLYHQHLVNLLEIKHAFLNLDLISLLKGQPQFSKLSIRDAQFNIFTDSTGYSNNYILQSKKKQKDSQPLNIEIARFELDDCSFFVENKLLHKKFAFTINKAKGTVADKDSSINIKMAVEAHFAQLGFNLNFGSFLKDALVKSNFNIDINPAHKTMQVHPTRINIDGEQLDFDALFHFIPEENIPFSMHFVANKLNYNKGTHWMSENIYDKLSRLKFHHTVNLSATIEGFMSQRGSPHVNLQFNTDSNKVELFDYTLHQVHFKGWFDNEVVKGIPCHDSNSVVMLDTLAASFASLPIRATNVSLSNFKEPFARAELAAQFDATAFNDIFSEHFAFSKGRVQYNLNYNGRLFSNTLIADRIYGTVHLKGVDFVYKERNLKFHDGNVSMRFNGTDLNIDQFYVQSNKSDINITGSSKDFLTAFMELPGKAQMDLKLFSNNIDLAAFQTYFTQRRSKHAQVSTGRAVKNASMKLDDFLSSSSVRLNMNVKKAGYKRFAVANLLAHMHFTEAGITIHDMSLHHADGHIRIKGSINQQSAHNPFHANVKVDNVRVDKFFYAMNNFGFSGLTDKNVEGQISVNAELKGNITDQGSLPEDKLIGTLQYELKNAALKSFAFFDKLKRFFPRRGLGYLEVPYFNGQLRVADGTIHIPPTTLATSALNLHFQGRYGLNKHHPTAIDIKVPLRNPQVDKEREKRGKRKRKGEGLVLHFKATSDKNGKVNIGLGKTADYKAAEKAIAAEEDD